MRYIGSKLNLLSHIEEVVDKLGVKEGIFCDLFAGTACVAAHFKRRGFRIISNDLLELSYAFQQALIANNEAPKFTGIVETLGDVHGDSLFANLSPYHKVVAWLNCLPGKKGFIFHNYCPSGNNEYGRQYLSDSNGQKIDAIRQQIQQWRDAGEITENEFYLLLLPLLEATSKVANISGTYGAYLKHWDPRTYKDLPMVPAEIIRSDMSHQVFRQEANRLIEDIRCDVLYLDPPYNTRQYITSYHLLETVARYDTPALHGKTGLRNYDKNEKSAYCSKSGCYQAFQDLIEKADARHILVSYNNEGILSRDEVMSILSLRGKPRCDSSIDYRRFKSNSHGAQPTLDNRVQELLFHLEVRTLPKRSQPKSEEKEPKGRYDPRNPLNDLSGSEWTYFLNSVELEGDEYNVGKLNNLSEEEWAIASAPVWDTYYPTSGSQADAHSIRKQHPSPKPPALMKRLIEFFTKKGGRVLDPFVGVGGTLLACSMAGRDGVGIDLSREYLEIYRQASAELGLEAQPFLCGDARDLENLLGAAEPFDLVLTDPPYSDMLSRKRSGERKKKKRDDSPTPFTDSPDDLGNMPPSQFYESLKAVLVQATAYLKPKGYVIVFCKDLQPTEKSHNMIHADVVETLADIENLRFRGYKIWYDKSLRLYPFGYPYAYVSNQLHQFSLIFRKEK
ncbi:DNA adenine methylase [Candidatus Poribacteria bacterium]|nr:DNA adenine methylase [Candidatus Poribacteria bacterium]